MLTSLFAEASCISVSVSFSASQSDTGATHNSVLSICDSKLGFQGRFERAERRAEPIRGHCEQGSKQVASERVSNCSLPHYP